MISAAATFLYESARQQLDLTLSLPRVTLHAHDLRSAAALFRALALIEPIYEPVHQTLDRNTILFAVGVRDDAKSA